MTKSIVMTLIFHGAYLADSLAGERLMRAAGLYGWPAWIAFIGGNSMIYVLLRCAVEPGWWRLSYKNHPFVIR